MIRNDADVRFDPVIAQLGPFQLGWHGIFTAIAVLVAVWLAGRLALQRGIPTEVVYAIAGWGVVDGVVCKTAIAGSNPVVASVCSSSKLQLSASAVAVSCKQPIDHPRRGLAVPAGLPLPPCPPGPPSSKALLEQRNAWTHEDHAPGEQSHDHPGSGSDTGRRA